MYVKAFNKSPKKKENKDVYKKIYKIIKIELKLRSSFILKKNKLSKKKIKNCIKNLIELVNK